MKCPACDGELSPYEAGGVTVDICRDRCGGVWFDAGELERFDELNEDAPQMLLQAVANQSVVVDRNRARTCPRCNPAVALTKRFFDSEHDLQLDQCDGCHGIFTDLGELGRLREVNSSAHERQKVVDDFYSKASNPNLPDRAKQGIRAVLQLLFK